MAATLHFATALLPNGWRDDVRIVVENGLVASIAHGVPADPADERHAVAVPGMASLHSHAFQRAMAGLAEHRSAESDTFWTWREAMYRVALSVSPDDVEAIASALYVEMLEAGFTRVGEFHYLHHDRDGAPFADRAEMAKRILAAASASGIGMTLLPAFYAHGDFGGASPNAGQRRFVSDLKGFEALFQASRAAAAHVEGANVGLAPHSLRAVTPSELAALVAMAPTVPIHIHAAEQQREVDACLAWSGRRPVEWLLDNAGVDSRWCLVHATHMNAAETGGVAASGATVGLCPITEANLGDGTFEARLFLDRGGRFGIGTDSNVLIDPAAELRQLEYSQRLAHRARNVLAASGKSTARFLFETAAHGGVRALGQSPAGLAAGAPADIVSLRRDHAMVEGRKGDRILDAWVFAARSSPVDCVWVRGVKQVAEGRHRRGDTVRERFRKVMRRLLA